MITAAADTVLMDGREVCIIRAHELLAGDVIVKHEAIDLVVLDVRRYPEHGFVVVSYSCTAGAGSRTLVAHSFVSIQPRVWQEEEGH